MSPASPIDRAAFALGVASLASAVAGLLRGKAITGQPLF
jgi:hypothetical protein